MTSAGLKRSEMINEMSRLLQISVPMDPQRAWTICAGLLQACEEAGMRPTEVSGGTTKYLVVTEYEPEEPRSGAV